MRSRYVLTASVVLSPSSHASCSAALMRKSIAPLLAIVAFSACQCDTVEPITHRGPGDPVLPIGEGEGGAGEGEGAVGEGEGEGVVDDHFYVQLGANVPAAIAARITSYFADPAL